MDIKIERAEKLKVKPDPSTLGFGKVFTDYMFVMDYTKEEGWKDARIIPFGKFLIHPASTALHYGSEIFEGMKAYYTPAGRILLFRPEANARRLNTSGARFCMPPVPEEDFVQAVKTLVQVDQDWVPHEIGSSLYIRPFIIGTEAHLGVKKPNTFQFIVILSPVGAYYPEGLDPVKIYVEDEYVRAVPGGTGFTKCGGNYAASIIAQYKAQDLGYTQVLWLDGVEHKYIEEVGTMNVMFKIKGEVVTPQLNGSILSGITRDSVLHLLQSWQIPVAERRISVEDLRQAASQGELEEVFGTGTAAVISPVGELNIHGQHFVINQGQIGALSQKLYDTLTGIQWGQLADPFGWTVEVK